MVEFTGAVGFHEVEVNEAGLVIKMSLRSALHCVG